MNKIVENYIDKKKIFLKELKECRKSFSMESVHRSRTTIRRLNSYIYIFSNKIPCSVLYEKLEKTLKLLSDLRDIQVQIDYFENSYEDFPKKEKCMNFLQKVEEKEIAIIEKKLDKMDFSYINNLLDNFQKSIEIYTEAHNDEIEMNVNNVISDLSKKAKIKEKKIRKKKPKSFHKFRIAMKKLRYSIEASQGIIGEQTQILTEMKEIQDQLGKIQDLSNFINQLKKYKKSKKKTKIKPIIEDLEIYREILMKKFYLENEKM